MSPKPVSSNRDVPIADAYTVPANECAVQLNTDIDRGLGSSEVGARLEQWGRNELQQTGREAWWRILLRQFTSTLILILVAAAVIASFVGSAGDTITILAIVVLNGALGFLQEWRAEHALAALQEMLAPKARVIRTGRLQEVDAAVLVPGDIVVLQTGDRVPADLRLAAVTDLQVEEAALTGESAAVQKNAAVVEAAAPLAERVSIAYMGTTVANGRGTGIVVATGMATELGKIASLAQSIEREPTPLERKLGQLGRQLGAAAVAISLLIALIGWSSGRPLLEMLMTGVSLAVAVVPEGLPAVVTITLAIGVTVMARKRALLRHLQAAEALGATDVICTDKTGTLTRNEMTVTRVWLPSGMIDVTGLGYAPFGQFTNTNGDPINLATCPDLDALLATAAICNNAQLVEKDDGSWDKIGTATEAALLTLAHKDQTGGSDPKTSVERAAEFSFNSVRKRMTIVTRGSGGDITAHVKGAPEVILDRVTHLRSGDQIRRFTLADRAKTEDAFRALAEGGLRTLALAQRTLTQGSALDADTVERDLILIGIVGIIDPPRPEVSTAIQEAQEGAGIKVVMITGDAALTAVSIARSVGLSADRVLTGPELDDLDDAELLEAINVRAVFARVAPEHKVRIVQVLQGNGQRVAMTGDGVNDAPALRQADVGVAMGIRGTDVARGAADMVLTDDNFASIVAAVREGRRQYENIQKFVCYLLSSNAAEVGAICIAILAGGPLILLPVQILWMNLVTDGPTALALGVEPADPDIMQRPPRARSEPVLSTERLTLIGGVSTYITLTTLFVFWYSGTGSSETLSYAQTMAFTAMILIEKVNVLSFRSLRDTRPQVMFGIRRNPWLWIAVTGSLLLQVAAIYAPPLQRALHTVPLTIGDWLLLLALALPVLGVGAAVKRWTRCRSAVAHLKTGAI